MNRTAAKPAACEVDSRLQVGSARRSLLGLAAKRGLDLAITLALMPAVAPVGLLVAILVKLDSRGPVLFRQRRLGYEGRTFTVLKFRTMRADASSDPHREYFAALAAGSAPLGEGELRKLTGDSRVTRVGAILRKLSMDELPQLINVLRGDMSLVGPRPAIDYELEWYRPEHFERFSVKPGLTGAWQVAGRSRLGVVEMLDLDVEYARAPSLRRDLEIIARTPRAMVEGTA